MEVLTDATNYVRLGHGDLRLQNRGKSEILGDGFHCTYLFSTKFGQHPNKAQKTWSY